MTARPLPPTPKTADKLVIEVGRWAAIPARSARGKALYMRIVQLGDRSLHTHDLAYPPLVGEHQMDDGCVIAIRERESMREAMGRIKAIG